MNDTNPFEADERVQLATLIAARDDAQRELDALPPVDEAWARIQAGLINEDERDGPEKDAAIRAIHEQLRLDERAGLEATVRSAADRVKEIEAEERAQAEAAEELDRALGASFERPWESAAGDSRPWVPGCDGWLRREARMTWFASRGQGKSLGALVLARQVCRAGGRVFYIDYENASNAVTNERLEAIAPGDEAVADRLALCGRFPFRRTESSPLARKAWLHKLDGVDLLIIDSLTRVLSDLGLNADDNSAVAHFYGQHVDPVAESGTAVLVLDNVGHDEANRTRGAASKLDLVEVAYKVSGGGKCSTEKHGTVTLAQPASRPARDGDIAQELRFGAGGGRYTDIVAYGAETDLLTAVLDALPAKSKNEIAKAVKEAGHPINRAKLLKAIDDFVENPGTSIVLEEGRYQSVGTSRR